MEIDIDPLVSMAAREAIAKLLPDCLEKRGDRYYPTKDGCIRLRELLMEHGIDAEITISDEDKFVLEKSPR